MCACSVITDCTMKLACHSLCVLLYWTVYAFVSIYHIDSFVSDQHSAADIFSSCCDIPDEGGGDVRELHRQIWKNMSHFL